MLSAFADLVVEKPFALITLDEIIETAKVTKGSLYHQFPSKYAIATELLEEEFDLGFENLRTSLDGLTPSLEMLGASMFESVRYQRFRPRYHAAVLLQTEIGRAPGHRYEVTDRWVGFFVEQLEAAKESGDVRPDIDSQRFGKRMLNAWVGIQQIAEFADEKEDVFTEIADLLQWVAESVVADDRRQYFETYVGRYAERMRSEPPNR